MNTEEKLKNDFFYKMSDVETVVGRIESACHLIYAMELLNNNLNTVLNQKCSCHDKVVGLSYTDYLHIFNFLWDFLNRQREDLEKIVNDFHIESSESGF